MDDERASAIKLRLDDTTEALRYVGDHISELDPAYSYTSLTRLLEVCQLQQELIANLRARLDALENITPPTGGSWWVHHERRAVWRITPPVTARVTVELQQAGWEQISHHVSMSYFAQGYHYGQI